MKIINNKYYYSSSAFIMSLIFGICGMVLPPLGVIDNSVLIWIGQLLLFTASILGINFNKKEN